jgi:hypothetical protein
LKKVSEKSDKEMDASDRLEGHDTVIGFSLVGVVMADFEQRMPRV